ncbi:hypothetical protein ACVW0I_006431 [Bradyrhizobium sp. LM6.11]
MCRNIKTLFNFEPPATEDEIHASAIQFVRKLSGFNKPSQANEAAFDRAVAEVSEVARKLLTSLCTLMRRRAIGKSRRKRRRNARGCVSVRRPRTSFRDLPHGESGFNAR